MTPSSSDEARQEQPRQPLSRSASFEPRKCWICFSDETEETPLSSDWRSPCPCSLTAHESCLLDWIDDLETTGTRKRHKNGNKVVCPQCKSEISIAQPRDPVVEAVVALERRAAKAAIPAVLGVVAGCTWTGCLIYGMNTVYVIFGPSMADRILGLDRYASVARAASPSPGWFRFFNPFVASTIGWSWRLAIGLPLIPVALVASRTRLADSILPIIPILFFATSSHEHEQLDLTRWPPSPALSIAALPYLRGLYNELYDRIAGPYERKWIKAVQPRHRRSQDDAGEAVNAEAGEGNDAGQAGLEANIGGREDDDVIFDVDIQVDIMNGDDDANEDEQPPQAFLHPPPPHAAAPEVQAAGNEAEAVAAIAAAADAAEENNPPPPAQRANDIVFSTSHLADTFIGALLFPSISGLMGQLMKMILPASWTTPIAPWERTTRASGILQARWGRSLVGGCLFVVLKDAVTLYVRWKQAQGHKYRRVLDYRGKAKRKAR